MSGHSKWKNIAHRKGKQDASRGQLFTKLCRNVFIAARRGGPNPDVNYALKMALEKARAASVPTDTLTRTIGKATGTLEGVHFEELLYEGYGPAGTAIMLELTTDNRNRTAAEIRHLFSKYGGSLGESGCVAWMFRRVGTISYPVSDLSQSDDELMLIALEAGADDFKQEDDEYVVYTASDLVSEVEEAMRGALLADGGIDIEYVPVTTVNVPDEEEERVGTLLSLLEEHDDVQSVYTNAVLSETDE